MIFIAIAINPYLSLNPYPPVAASPAATATAEGTRVALPPTPSTTPSPTEPAYPVPTPIRPATPAPFPTPAFPFSATVALDAQPDCAAMGLAGSVSDLVGEPLENYPVHVWGPGVEEVVLSGSATAYGPGGWAVTIPAPSVPTSTWYAQLHANDAFRHFPPISPILQVELSRNCQRNLGVIDFYEREK
ncbi:MAG: hypothetical protein JXD18_08975 [Anaerolineae bacterium]|nr:hypothetical protein [Anaerolineae bacterium]